MYLGPQSNQIISLSGVCNIPDTPTVSAQGISGVCVSYNSNKNTDFRWFSEKQMYEKYWLNYDNEYSYIKEISIKIIEKYLNKKQIKDREQCLKIIKDFHDDLIHEVILFLNKKNRKKSLLKYLTLVRKKILDAPMYVY